jgi:uncharacterized protein YvpB
MSKEPKRVQRRSVYVLLMVVTTISVLAFSPATAYADPGPVVAEALEVDLAEVPLYSQLDNAGVEWTSCGPTSLAMALNYRREGPTPGAVVDYATTHTGQDGEQLYKPHDPAKVFTSPQHLYEIAQHYGDPVQGWAAESESAQAKLRELLANDLPVIVDVTVSIARGGSTAAHFVVVTGLDADGTVYVNDPYGEGLGGQRRAVPWEDFYWAWQNNGDGHVGGHGWWMVPEMPQESLADELPVGDEGGTVCYLFSCDGLFLPVYPFTLHVDVGMCIAGPVASTW